MGIFSGLPTIIQLGKSRPSNVDWVTLGGGSQPALGLHISHLPTPYPRPSSWCHQCVCNTILLLEITRCFPVDPRGNPKYPGRSQESHRRGVFPFRSLVSVLSPLPPARPKNIGRKQQSRDSLPAPLIPESYVSLLHRDSPHDSPRGGRGAAVQVPPPIMQTTDSTEGERAWWRVDIGEGMSAGI